MVGREAAAPSAPPRAAPGRAGHLSDLPRPPRRQRAGGSAELPDGTFQARAADPRPCAHCGEVPEQISELLEVVVGAASGSPGAPLRRHPGGRGGLSRRDVFTEGRRNMSVRTRLRRLERSYPPDGGCPCAVSATGTCGHHRHGRYRAGRTPRAALAPGGSVPPVRRPAATAPLDRIAAPTEVNHRHWPTVTRGHEATPPAGGVGTSVGPSAGTRGGSPPRPAVERRGRSGDAMAHPQAAPPEVDVPAVLIARDGPEAERAAEGFLASSARALQCGPRSTWRSTTSCVAWGRTPSSSSRSSGASRGCDDLNGAAGESQVAGRDGSLPDRPPHRTRLPAKLSLHRPIGEAAGPRGLGGRTLASSYWGWPRLPGESVPTLQDVTAGFGTLTGILLQHPLRRRS